MRFSLKTKISTPRFDESLDYYKKIFEMTVVEEWDKADDKGAILAFKDGRDEAFLEIYFTDVVHDFSGLSLQFRVDGVDDFVRGLPDDCEYEGPKPRPWGARYVYLRDPNDILLIVYEGCM